MTGFTGSPLDRVDKLRSDPEAFVRFTSDWRGRILGLEGLDPVVSPEGSLVWKSMADVAANAELVLLGLINDKPHFVELTTAKGDAFRSPGMWAALSVLSGEEAAIYGTARALIDWHNSHKFCSRCGTESELFRSGWGRKCPNCGTDHFPRTDPVVIMLAEYEGSVLVGRQSRFPPGNYSALAGFLEPGESIEEAVRREIMEESGIPCGAVRYLASQPWPFGGSQLMIACVAQALATDITLDTDELEDAMWVTREDAAAALAKAPDAKFNAPPPFAIANSLLTRWVAGE